jgi:aspartokinase/homoserine dehydrogenase 1
LPFSQKVSALDERWVTHKFGGSSLRDAAAFRGVADIIFTGADRRQAVVVSASAGVTDALIDLVQVAVGKGEFDHELEMIRHRHRDLANELLDGRAAEEVNAALDSDVADINDVLKATSVMGAASTTAVGTVAGYGEVWSSRLLAAYLASIGQPATWVDAREVLVVSPAELAPVVDYDRSGARLAELLERSHPRTLVITGFIARDASGVPTTLGRNGSDYSASIFGALLDAEEIVIWTDVGGVMTADPTLVPQAHVLDELSYNEAMELAYFGARVIHPATMTPAIRAGIPIKIRNTFDPDAPGTRILPVSAGSQPVKGFASIGGIALLNLEGTAMIGVPGIAERLFGSLRSAGVSVIMISQGSSEHSICFAVPESESSLAKQVVEGAFASERGVGHLQEVVLTPDCTILAAVGDGMSGTPGIAARFFGALSRAGINIRSIAQGSSERNISIVIDSADAARALRAAHAGFYLSRQTISVGLIGPGHVGGALLDQVAARQNWLREEFGVELRVRAIASSRWMITDDEQIDLGSWRERLSDEKVRRNLDLEVLADHIQTESVPHAAIVDCTADATVAGMYAEWLGRGIHVVTPNKKANSADLEYYQRLREAGRRADAHYFYETTVGAALPVIQTLRDLVQTGDRIREIEGVFSGTLSYLFNSFDGTTPFSDIVAAARERGYTEPDPREDLSGLDVGRKIVILAREMGMPADLSATTIEGLIPAGLEGGSVEDFLDGLRSHDEAMVELVSGAREKGEVLRFVGRIDPSSGCSVSLRSYPADHPFARIKLTDNIVTFRTERYSENPLVVQGPGAGPQITAGGVFADLLRLANYLGATL